MRVSRPGVWPAVAVTGLLFCGALLGAARLSLAPVPGAPMTLDAWRRVLADPAFADAVGFTLALCVVTTALAALLALLLAAAVRGRRVVQAGVSLPVLVPHLLVATVAVLWLGPGGLADRVLGTLPVVLVRDSLGVGIVLVYLVKEVPFLTLLVLSRWGPSVAQRQEMAAVNGAGPLARLRHVVLPAVRAPLLLGSVAVAAFVLGSLQVPLVVGPTTPAMLPVWALRATRAASLTGLADAAVALLVGSGLALLLAVVGLLGLRRWS